MDKILFLCMPSGYVTESEARVFRRALADAMAAWAADSGSWDLRNALHTHGVVDIP